MLIRVVTDWGPGQGLKRPVIPVDYTTFTGGIHGSHDLIQGQTVMPSQPGRLQDQWRIKCMLQHFLQTPHWDDAQTLPHALRHLRLRFRQVARRNDDLLDSCSSDRFPGVGLDFSIDNTWLFVLREKCNDVSQNFMAQRASSNAT